MSDLYTECALYLSPGDPVRRGREAIHESFAGILRGNGDRGRFLDIRFHILDRAAERDLACDVGTFDLIYFDGSGEPEVRSEGKFVVVARRGKDDRWRFHVDSYSDR